MQMPAFEKHVWAEIDLDALRHNFRAVKARAGEMPLCAVVKADSYGHGAVECAKVFAEEVKPSSLSTRYDEAFWSGENTNDVKIGRAHV